MSSRELIKNAHDLFRATGNVIVRVVRINDGQAICFVGLVDASPKVWPIVGLLLRRLVAYYRHWQGTYFIKIPRWIHHEPRPSSIKSIAVKV